MSDGAGNGTWRARARARDRTAEGRVRPRYSPVRISDAATNDLPRAVRSRHQCRVPSPVSRIAAVRARSRSWSDPGAPADGRHRDLGQWREETCGAPRYCEAPCRHPRSRRHGRALHRQDGDAHRVKDQARGPRRPCGGRQRRSVQAGLSKQRLRERHQEPARRGDPLASAARCRGLAEDRRGSLRFRAPPRLRARRRRLDAAARGEGCARGHHRAVRRLCNLERRTSPTRRCRAPETSATLRGAG